jgi:Ice-binding-like
MLRTLSVGLLLLPLTALAGAGCGNEFDSATGPGGSAPSSSSSGKTSTSGASASSGGGGASGGSGGSASTGGGTSSSVGAASASSSTSASSSGAVDAGVDGGPAGPSLGSASTFAVLGGSTVTNTGVATTIVGDLGVSPGTALTGIPAGEPTAGVKHAGDPVAAQAQADVTIAYNALAAMPCDVVLTGKDLGGLTLTPGVYCYSSSAAQLSGALTLDAQGKTGAIFVFQIGSTLTTTTNSTITMINGGQACDVYWQVGSSATIGKANAFAGNILSFASITMMTGADLSGRALARTGAVTLDTNVVGSCAN